MLDSFSPFLLDSICVRKKKKTIKYYYYGSDGEKKNRRLIRIIILFDIILNHLFSTIMIIYIGLKY
jgi:hypothetical protein